MSNNIEFFLKQADDFLTPLIMNAKILIVIPTYNEIENIDDLQKEIFGLGIPNLYLLIVDDNSPDGTAVKIKELQQTSPKLFLIERESKQGLGSAYVRGFKFAIEHQFDYVFEMDADFSHSPKMIPSFLIAMKESDLVIGSRYINKTTNVVNWPLSRLFLSKGASLYTRLITRMPIMDPTSGFKCYRISCLQAIDLNQIKSTGYAFQIEIIFRIWLKKFRLVETPIVFVDRINGISKMNRKIVWEAIFKVWEIKIKSIFSKNF